MNTSLFASVENTLLLAGWTMFHFLWLGTLVAMAALPARWLLRRASANVRYVMALAFLATLAVFPIAIATWLHVYSPSVGAIASLLQTNDASQIANPGQVHSNDLKGNEPVELDLPLSTQSSETPSIEQPAPSQAQSTDTLVTPAPTTDVFTLAVVTINMSVHYLPWLWLIGTPITFALTTIGLLGTRRLRRASRPITDGPIVGALEKLAASLRLTRRVAVAVCDRIAAPVLIGILRPIILLPPAALTGYSPEEIEMVLLHELAHVRRWDNLVNFIQRLIESLLFFHPAVWLISSWVRSEREACCDALVVTRTDRPHAYAELLVALAAQMPRSVLFHPAASSAMAAGPLRSRIRRILKLDDDPMLISGKSFALVLAGLLVAATLVAVYLPTPAAASSGDAKLEAQTKNNLKNQMLALLNYEAAHKSFPANAIYSPEGKPLLSWRVAILPFIDPKLYDEFRRDEPWDSEHNRTLIARMPDIFKNPKLDQSGTTNYLAVAGDECFMIGTPKKVGIKHITDGTSLTIALVEADPNQAVEWTRPLDWKFDRDRPTQGLGKVWDNYWYHTRVDGSVHRVDSGERADRIGIHFTRSGGESKSLAESANRTATEFAGAEGGPVDAIDAALAGGPGPAPGEAASISPQAAVIEGHTLAKTGGVDAETELLLREITDIQKKNRELEGQLYQAQTDHLVMKSRLDDPQLAKTQKTRLERQQLDKEFEIRFAALKQQLANTQKTLEGRLKVLKDWNETSVEVQSRDAISNNSPGKPATATVESEDSAARKFPSLEDQKLADLAWKRLQLELEPLSESQLKKVKTLGYGGGVKVAKATNSVDGIYTADILVGLHAWPTNSLKDVAEILNRNDIDELNPLKYYVVRHDIGPNGVPVTVPSVRSGRISVNISDNRPSGGGFGAAGGSKTQSRSEKNADQRTLPSTVSVDSAETILTGAAGKRDAALNTRQEATGKRYEWATASDDGGVNGAPSVAPKPQTGVAPLPTSAAVSNRTRRRPRTAPKPLHPSLPARTPIRTRDDITPATSPSPPIHPRPQAKANKRR